MNDTKGDRTTSARETRQIRYFLYADGIPALVSGREFPCLVVAGEKRPFYDIEKFYREATAISKEDFDLLIQRTKTGGERSTGDPQVI